MIISLGFFFYIQKQVVLLTQGGNVFDSCSVRCFIKVWMNGSYQSWVVCKFYELHTIVVKLTVISVDGKEDRRENTLLWCSSIGENRWWDCLVNLDMLCKKSPIQEVIWLFTFIALSFSNKRDGLIVLKADEKSTKQIRQYVLGVSRCLYTVSKNVRMASSTLLPSRYANCKGFFCTILKDDMFSFPFIIQNSLWLKISLTSCVSKFKRLIFYFCYNYLNCTLNFSI